MFTTSRAAFLKLQYTVFFHSQEISVQALVAEYVSQEAQSLHAGVFQNLI